MLCSLSVNFFHARPFHYAIQGKFLLLTEFLNSWLSYNDSRLNFWIKDKVSVGDNKIYTDSNCIKRNSGNKEFAAFLGEYFSKFFTSCQLSNP